MNTAPTSTLEKLPYVPTIINFDGVDFHKDGETPVKTAVLERDGMPLILFDLASGIEMPHPDRPEQPDPDTSTSEIRILLDDEVVYHGNSTQVFVNELDAMGVTF